MRKNESLFRLMAPLLGALLSACGALSGGVEGHTTPAPSYAPAQTAPAQAYPAFPEDSVEVHDVSEALPDSAASVAQFTVPESMLGYTDAQVIASYRPRAARLGATWITLDPRGGQRQVVAYHVPAGVRIRRTARRYDSLPAASSTGSGSVHVRGYYRRDGTYVRPHTRSRGRRN